MESLIEAFSSTFSAPDVLGRLLLCVLFLVIAAIVSKALSWLFPTRYTRTGRYQQLRRWIPGARLVIWTVGLGFALYTLLTAAPVELVLMALPVALGLGLASQDLVRNVIAGVILTADRGFEVGDVIRIGEHEGEVQMIGLRHVELVTSSGHMTEIPNVQFLTQSSSNVTPNTKDAQVAISMLLPPHTSVTEARAIAYEAAAISRFASPRRPPRVFIDAEPDKPLETRLNIRGFVFDPGYDEHYRSDVVELIQEGLRARALPARRPAPPTGPTD